MTAFATVVQRIKESITCPLRMCFPVSLSIAIILIAGNVPARADCNVGANAQDVAVQGRYGCWRDLYLWVWKAYQLTDDSWNSVGISDACNISLPFAKVVNGAYVINYMLTDNRDLQWHSTEDYVSASRAGDNRFHGPFYQRFIEYDGSAEADSETGRFAARDRTNLHCPIFNLNGPSDDPVNRGSVLVHEAWHHWQRKYGFDGDHMSGPVGACTWSGKSCDWYYFHGLEAFEFGQLERYSTDPNHFQFHSPYQVQSEFDADVAELAQPWVPVAVTQKARYYGNTRLANAFVNRVGYRIGDPRPFAVYIAPGGSGDNACYTACHVGCGPSCSGLTGGAKGACLRTCATDCREGCKDR
jgi:hypothetical protein